MGFWGYVITIVVTLIVCWIIDNMFGGGPGRGQHKKDEFTILDMMDLSDKI